MTDQYGNNVNEEIRVPVKDWINQVMIGAVKDGSQKPFIRVGTNAPDSWAEFAIAYADGKLDEERYSNEGTARQELKRVRRVLEEYGVPEEYWPVLMERTAEIVTGSWKARSV